MENKDSKDILPKEERLKQIDLISDVVDLEYCLKYHKALESSEERVKQLEEEKKKVEEQAKWFMEENERILIKWKDSILKLDEENSNHKKQMEWLSQEYPEIREKLPNPESLQFGFIIRNEAQRIQGENNKIFAQHIKALEEENTRLKELFKDCWLESAQKSLDVPIVEHWEDELFNDWCNKNNITL